ncbi:MAG TPA: MaoC/PaaZ C-terminal domain-containing protein [Chitinophagaceae bacterium]|nr:MaoC/PaaZ C-terminal domain-containing protein [Chitinophagaceae bacterium]
MNVGDKIKLSFVVNETAYKGFISIFKDNNPLHTSKEYAISKGFKECVMHGNILNGFLSYFIGECLPTKDVIIHSQKIDFSKPVYLNDVLEFEAEVDEVFESVKVTRFKFYFKNSEGKKVAKGNIQIGLT